MNPVGSNTATPPAVGTAAPSSGGGSTPLNTKGALDKDAFLKLLVTQMKHQDPLNPTGNDQMAAQLAQFSSLEQLQAMNATLTNQAGNSGAIIASIQSSAAMGTLGKTVVATGNALVVPTNTDPTTIQVNARVNGADGAGVLTIMDISGKVVGSRNLGVVSAGPLSVDLGAAANGLPAGNYHYAINVTSSAGTTTPATTYTTGRVDSVQSTANGPVLIAGPIAIPFSSVIEIKN
jgi:flagellar basal-body rod modification protein FlgD